MSVEKYLYNIACYEDSRIVSIESTVEINVGDLIQPYNIPVESFLVTDKYFSYTIYGTMMLSIEPYIKPTIKTVKSSHIVVPPDNFHKEV